MSRWQGVLAGSNICRGAVARAILGTRHCVGKCNIKVIFFLLFLVTVVSFLLKQYTLWFKKHDKYKISICNINQPCTSNQTLVSVLLLPIG